MACRKNHVGLVRRNLTGLFQLLAKVRDGTAVLLDLVPQHREVRVVLLERLNLRPFGDGQQRWMRHLVPLADGEIIP